MRTETLTTPMTVIVVDDEPAARRGLRLLLERDPGIRVVGEAASGDEAVTLVRQVRPELAFLDVQMPGLSGFDVIASLSPAEVPAVVFVTAYDEHAIQAFEVNAVDYLLKPFEDDRFQAALERAKSDIAGRRREVERTGQAAPGRILLKSAGEIYFLKPEEIDWVEAEGDYMRFHVGAKSHLLRETMAQLEKRLDPARFIRIHRSTIVNIDRVLKVSPSFVGEYVVTLQDGTKLKLSRGYQPRLSGLLKTAL